MRGSDPPGDQVSTGLSSPTHEDDDSLDVDLKAAGYLRAHACCTALTLPIGNAGSIVVISVDVSRNSRICPSAESSDGHRVGPRISLSMQILFLTD